MATIKEANDLLDTLPSMIEEYVKKYRAAHGKSRFKFEYLCHDYEVEGDPIDWSVTLHIRQRRWKRPTR